MHIYIPITWSAMDSSLNVGGGVVAITVRRFNSIRMD